MKIGIVEVNQFLSFSIFDIGIIDIPFLRYGPIEYSCAGRYFANLKR